MKKSNTILPILQSVLTTEEVQGIVEATGYVDNARKFTVYHLLQYWIAAASEEWSGYRFGVDHAACSGLSPVHYSCFSGKAADVPFAVFKELFQLLVRKCNRETRRKLAFPKELLLIDSTTMTVGKSRLPWAPYHGERTAVKLHVALRAQNGQPPRKQLAQDMMEPYAKHWRTRTLSWSWTVLMASSNYWIVTNKTDNPLSFVFATMFISKNLMPCGDKLLQILKLFGYHVPTGNTSVPFKAASSCRHFS